MNEEHNIGNEYSENLEVGENSENQQVSENSSPNDGDIIESAEVEQETVPETRFLFINADILNSRYYNNIGFYCALSTVENPKRKFQEIIEEQKSQIQEQQKGLGDYFSARESRYASLVEDIEKKISDEKDSLAKHLLELPEAIQRALDAEKEKDRLEKELAEKTIAFGVRKASLVTEAIETVRSNMEALIENYRKVYEQRSNINQLTYKDNQPSLNFKIEQFKKIKQNAESQWNRLVLKMERLHFDGINPALVNWLFYVGLSVATVCGAYFFSIFVLAKQMNDANITFFVLTGFERFIVDFYPNWSTGQRFLMLTGWLLGISFVISFLAWWCWKLLAFTDIKEVDEPIKNKSKNLQLELSDERQLSFDLKAQSSSFFKFLLQILPIFIVLGIFFFIAFLGQDPKLSNTKEGLSELQKLDISLTGAAIGTLITLLVAALSCLYIIKIIEPRSERMEANHTNLLASNFELVAASLVFLVSVFLLFFLEKNDLAGGKQQSVIFQYGPLVMANGFLLGYALRLKGLFASVNFLERKTLALTNSIRDNSRPRPLNLTAKEDRVFRKEYFRLQRELFNLMLLKTQLGNQSLGGQNANKMPKTKPIKSQPAEQTWRRFLFFKKKNKSPSEAMSSNIEEETVPLISIKDWEIRLYPAETIELEQIGKDLVRARIRNRETKEYMEALKENRSSFCDTIQKQIKRLEDAKRSAKVNYEKVIFQRSHYMRALRQQSDSIQSDIREGFNLGIFFRSKVGSDFIPFIEDYAQDANFKIIESKIPDTTKVTQNNQIEDLNPTENE